METFIFLIKKKLKFIQEFGKHLNLNYFSSFACLQNNKNHGPGPFQQLVKIRIWNKMSHTYWKQLPFTWVVKTPSHNEATDYLCIYMCIPCPALQLPKTKSLFGCNLILMCVCNLRRLYSQRLKLKQSRDFGLWSENVLNSQIRLIKSRNARRRWHFPLFSATAWDRVISLEPHFSVEESSYSL